EPELAPPGGHVVIVQKMIEIDYDSITDWSAHKAAIESYVMKQIELIIPGFKDRIICTLSASALTSYKFTLNQRGAMLGWEMAPDQLGAMRPGVRGPLKNLYFVGHWTQPGGGITPVIVSALQAASLVTETGLPGLRMMARDASPESRVPSFSEPL
ncbi:MAG TPA: FAD-dependent oxidoreductase, partial [Blastocatellia bacterium]|nr:FAD-dependent oxidoreductase [Blastocatellia bacterium]